MSSGFSRASALAGVSLVLGSLITGEATPAPAPDSYAKTHALLQAAYPGLSGQALVFNVQGDIWAPYDGVPKPFLSMAITVRRQHVRPPEPVKPLLSAFISFAKDLTLSNFIAQGEFVNTEKCADFRQWMSDHEGASETEVASTLASRGARFLQRDQMRAEALLETKRIGPVLGRIQLQRLELDDSPAYWKAEVFISTGAGRRLYNMLFESFDGRLVSMGRVPG